MTVSDSVGVTILNPLGTGLRHYREALRENLAAGGFDGSTVEFDEPSAAKYGRVGWIARYASAGLRLLFERDRGPVVVTWPVLGYLDLAGLGLLSLRRPVTLIVHDPQPLVRALGYSGLSRRIGRLVGSRVTLIAHSDAAQTVLRAQGWRDRRVVRAAHPIAELPMRSSAGDGESVVRVLGQYKPDRDLDALREIAADLPDVHLEIVGRGWPEVAGWNVRSDFVPEDEFDRLLASSSAIVVPYKRFFQSGVAIRALERGVPVVGPAGTSIESLLGADSPWLAHDGGWVEATRCAVTADRATIEPTVQAARVRAISDWSRWVALVSR